MVPRIGITMGDPAGIGSEITAKMLLPGDIQKFCTPVIFGDAGVIRQGFNLIGAEPDFGIVVDLDQALEAGRSYVYDLDNLSPDDYALGQISAEAGRAAGAAEFFAALPGRDGFPTQTGYSQNWVLRIERARAVRLWQQL